MILNGLRWLGLDWDEGPISGDAAGPSKGDAGPYFQRQRKENYTRRVEELLMKGLAYEDEGTVKFKMTQAKPKAKAVEKKKPAAKSTKKKTTKSK